MQIKGLVNEVDNKVKETISNWIDTTDNQKFVSCLNNEDAEALYSLMSSRYNNHMRLCNYMVQLLISIGNFQFATSLLDYQFKHSLKHELENLYLDEIPIKDDHKYIITKCHINKFYDTELFKSCLVRNSVIDELIVDIDNENSDTKIIAFYKWNYQTTIKSIKFI